MARQQILTRVLRSIAKEPQTSPDTGETVGETRQGDSRSHGVLGALSFESGTPLGQEGLGGKGTAAVCHLGGLDLVPGSVLAGNGREVQYMERS